MQILAVDDDEELLELISSALKRQGYGVITASSGAAARTMLADHPVDLMVLDVALGDSNGLDLCAALRADGVTLPILFLSARGTVSARVDGLDAGGDDYLAKPFAMRELVARVRALSRRGPALHPQHQQLGPLRLDVEARQAMTADGPVELTAREWSVLQRLLEAKGRVVSYDALLERAWGDYAEGARSSLEVIVSRLRKKLRSATGEAWIRTARGLGYALDVPATAPPNQKPEAGQR